MSSCIVWYANVVRQQLNCVSLCRGQVCHIGDALADDAVVPGGFAGIVVDLFAEGQILPALHEVCFQ